MKKCFLQLSITLTALCGALTMSAQESSPRSAGYRGSVTLTDQYFVIVGFDTSHGYMFNEHHYLGAGVGGFFIPVALNVGSGGLPIVIQTVAHHKPVATLEHSNL